MATLQEDLNDPVPEIRSGRLAAGNSFGAAYPGQRPHPAGPARPQPSHSFLTNSLQGGLPARAARPHRHLASLRAPDVPGHQDPGARGVLPPSSGQRR